MNTWRAKPVYASIDGANRRFGLYDFAMIALAMVVVASMVETTGLGIEMFLVLIHLEVRRSFTAGSSITFLSIIIDRITHAIAARQQYTVEELRLNYNPVSSFIASTHPWGPIPLTL